MTPRGTLQRPGAMGSWGDWTTALSAVLSSGVSLVAPQIEQATGWDLNANDSPFFSQVVVPVGNTVGNAMGYGPAGDYLSGTAQAVAGKVPLPVGWTGGVQLPADILDRLGTKPATAPAAAAPTATAPAPGTRPAPVKASSWRSAWPRYRWGS